MNSTFDNKNIDKIYSHLHSIFTINNTPINFNLLVSGSTRLGVADESSDVDLVLAVTPENGTRDIVLRKVYDSLKSLENIRDLILISGARVPIVTFVYDGVEFDIAVCIVIKRNAYNGISLSNLKGIDLENDSILNGPRNIEYVLQYVKNKESFNGALVLIRQWAKARQIYGSKYGYLSGITLTLMTAFIARFESDKDAIVRMFFKLFSKWDWTNRILSLNRVDNFYRGDSMTMVVLTPIQPVINTTLSVNKFTCRIIVEELCRAHTLSEWAQIIQPVTMGDFLSRWKHCLVVSYADNVENDIVTARLLKLSHILSLPPYDMETFAWTHPLKDKNGNINLYLALQYVGSEPKQVSIYEGIEKWKQSFSHPVDVIISLEKTKRIKML